MKTLSSIGPAFLIPMSMIALAPAVAQERPEKLLAFRQGYMAYEDKQWRQVADFMKEAETTWEEDGEPTNVGGRWREPYLPRYYLGVALYRLGCYREALNHFDHSILCRAEIRWAKSHLQDLQSLRKKAERYVDRGIEEIIEEGAVAQCADWHIDYPVDQTGDCTALGT